MSGGLPPRADPSWLGGPARSARVACPHNRTSGHPISAYPNTAAVTSAQATAARPGDLRPARFLALHAMQALWVTDVMPGFGDCG
jgi:hypothetical protein